MVKVNWVNHAVSLKKLAAFLLAEKLNQGLILV